MLSVKCDVYAFGLVILEALTSLPVDFTASSLRVDDPRFRLLASYDEKPYPRNLLDLWRCRITMPDHLVSWADSDLAHCDAVLRDMHSMVSYCLVTDPRLRATAMECLSELEVKLALMSNEGTGS